MRVLLFVWGVNRYSRGSVTEGVVGVCLAGEYVTAKRSVILYIFYINPSLPAQGVK